MAEKEKALFETSNFFGDFIFRVLLCFGIIGCVIYFNVNPAGLSVVMFLIACVFVFAGSTKIVVFQNRFLSVQKRIINKMDSVNTYNYQELESVEFRPDNFSWINTFLSNQSGRRRDKFLIFYKKDGKAESIDVNSSRSEIRNAEALINDHIKQHLTHHHEI
jgi:hypothetical protein